MEVSIEAERDALLALLDRMVRAEAREQAPAQADRGDWLYGSVGTSEPDAQGWMVPPIGPKLWIPRALCFWHLVLRTGGTVSLEQMAHPAHSLARWPAIERAVQAYLAAFFPGSWLVDSADESLTLH